MTMRHSHSRRSPVRRWLTRPLLFAAAVALVIEEWLWNGTAAFLRELARLPLVARCGDWIRRRTPYQALALFVLPVLALLPLKGAIVLAFAHGRVALGVLVLVLEKLIFSAIFAALYQLTGPAVTQIGWVLRGQQRIPAHPAPAARLARAAERVPPRAHLVAAASPSALAAAAFRRRLPHAAAPVVPLLLQRLAVSRVPRTASWSPSPSGTARWRPAAGWPCRRRNWRRAPRPSAVRSRSGRWLAARR